jgi:hypothetical protein
MSAAVNRSCTSQCPFQAMISTEVSAAVLRARYSSGSMMTPGTSLISAAVIEAAREYPA